MDRDANVNKYVYWEESPNNDYIITINHEKFPFPTGTKGSYNVFLARLAGLSYPNFLRMCRDMGGATLIGKGNKYVVPHFKFTEGLYAITKWLNKRAEYIVYRHEHPYEFVVDGDEIKKELDYEVEMEE